MIVYFYNSGQTGNRLNQAVYLICLGKETGQSVINLSFNEYYRYFEFTKNNRVCAYPRSWFLNLFGFKTVNFLFYRVFLLAKRFKLNNRLISIVTLDYKTEIRLGVDYKEIAKRISEKKSILTFYDAERHWYDHSDYFVHHKEISRLFAPVLKYQVEVNEISQQLRKDNNIVVGVHIRRGDYKSFGDGTSYFEDEVYTHYMDEVLKLLAGQKVIFYICSDEEIDTTNYTKYTYYFKPKHMITDMYMLAECDYILGPQSTFSMWASYYGQVPLYKIRYWATPGGKLPMKEINYLEQKIRITDFEVCNNRRLDINYDYREYEN
jgi:hypothetical protein